MGDGRHRERASGFVRMRREQKNWKDWNGERLIRNTILGIFTVENQRGMERLTPQRRGVDEEEGNWKRQGMTT